jgi:hypothetical protein
VSATEVDELERRTLERRTSDVKLLADAAGGQPGATWRFLIPPQRRALEALLIAVVTYEQRRGGRDVDALTQAAVDFARSL